MASAEAQRGYSFPSESLHKVQQINTNNALGDYKKQLGAFLDDTQVRLPSRRSQKMDENERGWMSSCHKPLQGNAVALLNHLPKSAKGDRGS